MNEFDYMGFLTGLGIQKGDLIDVSSDLMSFLVYCKFHGLKFDANRLLDAIIDIVGDEGTVMVRAFTWEFCKGKTFDINNSLSRVGALGNYALRRSDFSRTGHPIYSWCVSGKLKDDLVSLSNIESFGFGSPFEFLMKNNGKFLVMGNIKGTAMTMVHHYEKLAGVPYRDEKIFEGEYIDEKGEKSIRRYSMYVRPLNYGVEGVDDFLYRERVLWIAAGKIKAKEYDNMIPCYYYPYSLIEELYMKDITQNGAAGCMRFDNPGGYWDCNVNWNLARYYS